MPGPTPDFDTVSLVWWGNYLDGSPATGSIEVSYDGGVQLDPSTDKPVSTFPIVMTATITPKSVQIADKNGVQRTVAVGEATFQVPVSNDPDIQGGGGTYKVVEKLDQGGGRTFHVVADKDAPGGVIKLNEVAPTDPIPGVAYSAVTITDFNTLTGRVTALESSGGGSGTVKKVANVDPDVNGNVPLTKSHVGLGNVDNTSDALKPVSAAQAAAIAGKEPALPAGTANQYLRGDKTMQTLNKAAVGLGNVDNTSDANKPVSTATQTALDTLTSSVAAKAQAFMRFWTSGSPGSWSARIAGGPNIGMPTLDTAVTAPPNSQDGDVWLKAV